MVKVSGRLTLTPNDNLTSYPAFMTLLYIYVQANSLWSDLKRYELQIMANSSLLKWLYIQPSKMAC